MIIVRHGNVLTVAPFWTVAHQRRPSVWKPCILVTCCWQFVYEHSPAMQADKSCYILLLGREQGRGGCKGMVAAG